VDSGWYAKLHGDGQVLAELVDRFTDPRLRVTAEPDPNGGYYLTSTEFEGMTNPDDVRSTASELLQIACGAIQVERDRPWPWPHVESLLRLKDDGASRDFYTLGPVFLFVPPEAVLGLFPGNEEIRESAERAIQSREQRLSEKWAKIALRSDDVRDALAILGRDDVRWHDLYHVFEIVESNVGERIHREGWATKAEVKRFRRTANSRRALGREARHGHKQYSPPKKPMALDQARKLVFGIVREWLRARDVT
jgi:hypothetical protein